MCFFDTDPDDNDSSAVRVTEYRSRSLKIPVSPTFRRRFIPLPTIHTPSTTITYKPRPSVSSAHCTPPHSPRSSYTTITRKHTRTRQETIYPVERMSIMPHDYSYGERVPVSRRLVEYVEAGEGQTRKEVEYISIR